MKKIAVCISGQPRSVKAGYEYLKRNLLNLYPDNVEIFVHTWSHLLCMPDDIRYTYDITSAQVDQPLDKYSITRRYPRVDSPDYPAINTYSMWYSVFRANMLKKLYEDQVGYKFDYVVRTRFDYALNRTIDFDKIEPNKVYVPACRIHPEHMFCSDMFAYGTSAVMDRYSNTFMNIDSLYDMGVTMNGEHMLSANLQLYGLVRDNMVYVDMKNPFPPGKYNGNYHSIIRDDFTDWNKNRA